MKYNSAASSDAIRNGSAGSGCQLSISDRSTISNRARDKQPLADSTTMLLSSSSGGSAASTCLLRAVAVLVVGVDALHSLAGSDEPLVQAQLAQCQQSDEQSGQYVEAAGQLAAVGGGVEREEVVRRARRVHANVVRRVERLLPYTAHRAHTRRIAGRHSAAVGEGDLMAVHGEHGVERQQSAAAQTDGGERSTDDTAAARHGTHSTASTD